MTAYFIRRLLLMIPTFIGITFVVFFTMRAAPGGPIEQARQAKMAQMQQQGGAGGGASATAGQPDGEEALTPEEEARLMKEYGISDNILADYGRWIANVVRLDFGESNIYGIDVLKLIISKMPISIFFGLISMFVIYAVCIPLGLMKAIKHRGFFDNASSLLVYFGYAIPGYALGALLVVFVASNWQLLPLGGFVSENFASLSFGARVVDLIKHAILPMCCYLIGSFAFMTMLMKNQLMEQMSADYVRTALAKGVSYKRAIFRHALDNSLIPIATTFGNQISLLVGGSFLIESIFNIDGIGMLGFTSILSKDYTVVMGVLAISATLQLLGNILSDLCVAAVDPRVKFG
ncbi:MAG: ABC transporter permease subunit [Verrucomicrobia bacterium]|nr:ABC transporter permease subunit [Verrucomicrobiota bacterium]